jgi:hypothetical protein
MSVPSTPATARDDAEMAERVDALIARMTVAEKAGQLTQYFHVNLPPSAGDEANAPGAARPELGDAVEAALARGEVGSLLFVTDPAELRYWNAAARDWVIDPTTIDVFTGTDSTAALTASFTIGA